MLLAAADSSHALSVLTDNLDLSCVKDLTARELRCSYRMDAAEPVIGISAVADGNPLTITNTESYPWDRAVTAILILVDTSDPARQNVVAENQKIIRHLLGMAGPHDQIGLASFDKTLRLEAPPGATPDVILTASGNLRATGKTTELYRSVLAAIAILKKIQADRKAIYLMSDGLAEDQAYFHQDVVKAAKTSGVVITSLGFPRSVAQSVGLQTLRRLSEETGGIYVESDDNFLLPDDFLGRPFDSLDNGGRFTVSVPDLIPSDKDKTTLEININTGTGSKHAVISLAAFLPEQVVPVMEPATSVAATQPPAPAAQPPVRIITREAPVEPDYFWSWYLVLVALIFLLILVITAFFMTVYRQGKKKSSTTTYAAGPVDHKPYAYLVLQDETKKRYPITRTTWRLGRGSDNEMTLQDNSVSRRHAEIHRDKGDVFTIFDLDSLNGVFVNSDKVQKQTLHEGDIIEIGDISLRFTLHSNEYALEDATAMQHTKSPLTH